MSELTKESIPSAQPSDEEVARAMLIAEQYIPRPNSAAGIAIECASVHATVAELCQEYVDGTLPESITPLALKIIIARDAQLESDLHQAA